MKLILLPSVLLAFIISGCSITRNVEPVTVKISDLCIKKNPKVLMNGFLPELRNQIESHWINTTVFDGKAPDNCAFQAKYTANWSWDIAMWLTYAEIAVYQTDSKNRIGRGIYDAQGGGGRLDKFGHTAVKLKTITEPLFEQAGQN